MSETTERLCTNLQWTSLEGQVHFVADASDLAIMTGMHPSKSFEARDPWHRALPTNSVVWSVDKVAGETRKWTCTVRAPDGVAVRLTIFND